MRSIFVLAFLGLIPAHFGCATARVEHGLIPEVRVQGERGGWSIEERLRAHHTPAVSIAVIHNHRVVWARAYGVANRRTGQRADAATPFNAASISKMVTALAALKLVERGQVSFDADINQGLRSWKLPENPFKLPVTLKQLLSHTAGTNLHSVSGYRPGTPLPTLPQILDGIAPAKTAPVRVEDMPGKAYRYSGGGTLIVQQLVVDQSQLPFPEAMQRMVFAPLGLVHSTFEVPGSHAAAHDYDESVLPEIVYPESAAAGLWTTPSDLAHFLIEIQLGLKGQSQKISVEVARRMTTAIAPIGIPDVWTGAGTFVERHGHTMYFGHDGLNDGYLSVSRATTTGDGAVVMANGAGAAPLIFEVLRSIAVEYHWDGWFPPPVKALHLAPEKLRALAGEYGSGVDRWLSISVHGDRLQAQEPFGDVRELVPVGNDGFLDRDGTVFQFHGAELKVGDTSMTRSSGDQPLRLLEAGRDAEALALYRALLSAHPSDPALAESRFDELGSKLLDRRFDLPGALRVFAVEAALYPQSANANAGLALAYLRAGRRAEAEPFRDRARALLPAEKHPEIESIYLGMRMERIERLR